MKIILFLLLTIVVIFGISFACLNASPVHLNYYFGERTLPLSMLLVLTLVVGVVLGFMVSIMPLIHLKTKNYRLRQRLRLMEEEVENLRAIPIQDQH